LKCKEHQKAGLREGIAPNLSTQSGAKGIDLVWKTRKFGPSNFQGQGSKESPGLFSRFVFAINHLIFFAA